MQLPAALDNAQVLEVPADTCLFRQGDPCDHFVVLLEGSTRVFTRGESGKESLLYRLHANDMCVLTASCLIGEQHYSAEAVTETPVRLKRLSKAKFHELLYGSPDFNRFVFHNLSQKLGIFVNRFEQLQTTSIAERLEQFLRANARGGELKMTHQAIADEIGSVREVVSRHLHALADAGHLRLGRGKIILNS